MPSQHDNYTVKHVDQYVTFSFEFNGCDSTFTWIKGSSIVRENINGEYTKNLQVDCRCKDNLKSVIKCVREIKQNQAS